MEASRFHNAWIQEALERHSNCESSYNKLLWSEFLTTAAYSSTFMKFIEVMNVILIYFLTAFYSFNELFC